MSNVNTVYVKSRLRVYEAPNTASQEVGTIDAGRYRVIAVQRNYPTTETDYVQLEVPQLGGQHLYICSRWTDKHYAILETEQEAAPVSFEDDPEAIDEQHLVDTLPPFHPYVYDLQEPYYPQNLPGVKLPLGPPYQNNCCTLVEGVVVGGWAAANDDFTWNKTRHGQMMITSADDYFSPVTALVESGMAVKVTNLEAAPQPWTAIQGWRKQWGGGHTFIILAHHAPTDRVLTLESNKAFHLNGVGFRQLGNLRDFPDGDPPARWWEFDELFTWEKIKATYPYRAHALLKVKNRQWVNLPS